MDVNSRALYMLVVDAVRAKVVTVCQSEDLLHADSLLRITIERPTMAAVHDAIEQNRQRSRYQSCPFCATSLVQHTRAATRRQPCGCGTGFDLQHILLANGIANDVFLEAEEIFQTILAFDQSTTLSHGAEHASVAVPEALVEAVRAFVTSPKMGDLDEKGWRLQSLFAKVFSALLRRTSRTIAFPVGCVDPNSTRLFAVIWRKWMQQLAEAKTAMPADTVHLWTLRLDEPSIRAQAARDGTPRDLTTEELAHRYFTAEHMQQQRYHGDTRAHRLLQNNSRTMCQIARLILKQDGARDAVDRSLRALLQRLQTARWDITASVLLMRRGVRELPFLVPDDLDSNSSSVVEAILRVVVSIERGDGLQAGDVTEDDRLDFEAFVRHHVRRNVGGTAGRPSEETSTSSTEAVFGRSNDASDRTGPQLARIGSNPALLGSRDSERRRGPLAGVVGVPPPPPFSEVIWGNIPPVVEAFRASLLSSGLPPEHQHDRIMILIRILNKVLDSEEIRYRRLFLTHGAVATHIAPHAGAVAILETAGFRRDGDVLTIQTVIKPLISAIIIQLSKMLHGPADDAAIYGGP